MAGIDIDDTRKGRGNNPQAESRGSPVEADLWALFAEIDELLESRERYDVGPETNEQEERTPPGTPAKLEPTTPEKGMQPLALPEPVFEIGRRPPPQRQKQRQLQDRRGEARQGMRQLRGQAASERK